MHSVEVAKQKGFWFSGGKFDLEACSMLAREWALRGDYYYSVYLANGAMLTEEQLDGYPPNDSFVEWACELDIHSNAFDEVMVVNSANPTNPS